MPPASRPATCKSRFSVVGQRSNEKLLFSLRPADVRLRKLAEEKDELLAQIRKLKNHLEEERQKHSKVDSSYTDGERMENGTDLHFIEMQSKLTWGTGKSTFEP